MKLKRNNPMALSNTPKKRKKHSDVGNVDIDNIQFMTNYDMERALADHARASSNKSKELARIFKSIYDKATSK